VAPFVEPANRLVRRGHDVTYVVPEGYHELFSAERFQLGTYPLDFSSRVMHTDPEHVRLMRHPVRNTMGLTSYWMRKGFGDDPDRVRTGLLDQFAGADVVLTHASVCSVTGPVARAVGAKLVIGHLFPMVVPTSRWTFPHNNLSPDLGVRLNKVLWRLFAIGSGLFSGDRQLNAYRRKMGVEPQRGTVTNGWMDADRTVLLVSPRYYPEDRPEWPVVTWGGFSHWTGPAGADRDLDPEVEAFLDAGDPPVLVTLGTSAATGAGEQFATIAAGLDDLGLRSLLLVGNADNLAAVRDRKGAFVFAPLATVLPRCRAAVISGSLGTTAATLAAGVPAVVVPQLLDQAWHGERLEDLGVGLKVRRARQVPEAIARIEADPGYRSRAADLAAELATEDGAGALADAVESLLPGPAGSKAGAAEADADTEAPDPETAEGRGPELATEAGSADPSGAYRP
jgi:rhamnosyltransferase subunit B